SCRVGQNDGARTDGSATRKKRRSTRTYGPSSWSWFRGTRCACNGCEDTPALKRTNVPTGLRWPPHNAKICPGTSNTSVLESEACIISIVSEQPLWKIFNNLQIFFP